MVCMRMGLENVVDSMTLLRDKYQELIGRLGPQLPGCGVISRTESMITAWLVIGSATTYCQVPIFGSNMACICDS